MMTAIQILSWQIILLFLFCPRGNSVLSYW